MKYMGKRGHAQRWTASRNAQISGKSQRPTYAVGSMAASDPDKHAAVGEAGEN